MRAVIVGAGPARLYTAIALARRLPSDLVVAAVQADPELITVVGPYQAMLAPPGSLGAAQARVREIYASGWRPPIPPGPSRQELAALVTAAAQRHRCRIGASR